MLRVVLALSSAASLITSPAFAMGQTPPRPKAPAGLVSSGGVHGGAGSVHNVHAVPEIDASSGLLAVAAVAAVMLFVWERRRRQAK